MKYTPKLKPARPIARREPDAPQRQIPVTLRRHEWETVAAVTLSKENESRKHGEDGEPFRRVNRAVCKRLHATCGEWPELRIAEPDLEPLLAALVVANRGTVARQIELEIRAATGPQPVRVERKPKARKAG